MATQQLYSLTRFARSNEIARPFMVALIEDGGLDAYVVNGSYYVDAAQGIALVEVYRKQHDDGRLAAPDQDDTPATWE